MSAEPGHNPQHPDSSHRSRARTVKPGRLPVTEATSDRPGAGSPFGDDVVFPLPVQQLRYEHPER